MVTCQVPGRTLDPFKSLGNNKSPNIRTAWRIRLSELWQQYNCVFVTILRSFPFVASYKHINTHKMRATSICIKINVGGAKQRHCCCPRFIISSDVQRKGFCNAFGHRTLCASVDGCVRANSGGEVGISMSVAPGYKWKLGWLRLGSVCTAGVGGLGVGGRNMSLCLTPTGRFIMYSRIDSHSSRTHTHTHKFTPLRQDPYSDNGQHIPNAHNKRLSWNSSLPTAPSPPRALFLVHNFGASMFAPPVCMKSSALK